MSNEEFSKNIGPQDVKVARDEVTNNDSEDLFEEYYNPTNKYTESAECSNDKRPSACDPSKNLDLAHPSNEVIMRLQPSSSLGAKLSEFSSCLRLPPISISNNVFNKKKGKVFVHWPLTRKENELVVPQPFPERSIKDRWDENHVRMPCSNQSQFPVSNSDGTKILKKRWDLIENALSSKIANANDFEEKILSYNRSGRWNFIGIQDRFSDDEENVEHDAFFNSILPEVCNLALRLPFVITAPIPLLRRGCNQSLTFSQHQIASLLANAFFCTFPRRNATGRQTEYSNFPFINFNRLFGNREDTNGEKLSCLINYFRRVTQGQPPKGLVTFTRRSLSPTQIPDWNLSTKTLRKLKITSTGTIEDDGIGMLQVDFANSYIGGGVLSHGCVQEEIRFMICPELIASMLFTEQLDDLECLTISGHERYSNYRGYASNFQFSGNHVDRTEMDTSPEQGNKRKSYLVAIDALYFRDSDPQYNEYNIVRELNKAFVGFHSEEESGGGKFEPVAVATGNWGCGAFGGDPHLKALIQLMAATQTDRDMYYFTFGDKNLRDTIYDMYSFLQCNEVTVGKLYEILTGYYSILKSTRGAQETLPLYKYIKMQLNCYDQETDEELESDGKQSPTHPISSGFFEALDKEELHQNDDQMNSSSELHPKNSSSDNNERPMNTSEESISSSKSEKQAKLTDYFSRK